MSYVLSSLYTTKTGYKNLILHKKNARCVLETIKKKRKTSHLREKTPIFDRYKNESSLMAYTQLALITNGLKNKITLIDELVFSTELELKCMMK